MANMDSKPSKSVSWFNGRRLIRLTTDPSGKRHIQPLEPQYLDPLLGLAVHLRE